MSTRIRLLMAIALIALIGFTTLALTIAQPPTESPAGPRRTLELPDLPDGAFRRNPGAPNLDPGLQHKIRAAIESGDFAETGDPGLDEVLQILQKQGSVLDGSILEPAADEGIPEKRPQSASVKARAAECLLKAARVLEKIDPADKTRRDLVNQMRRESVRLLTQ